MENFFIRIYHYFEKRRTVFFIFLIGCFLLAAFFALRLRFEEDISKILPKDKKIEKLNQVFQNSKFLDRLVVMISLKDSAAPAQPDSLVSFAGDYINAVQQKLAPYIKGINGRVDDTVSLDLFNTISDHLPVYLDEEDYRKIDTLITPEKIRETLANDLKTLASPAGFALKKMISIDPAGISFLGLKKLQQLQYDENFELYDNYILTKDHKHLLIFITPAYPPGNTGMNASLLKGMDSIGEGLSRTAGNIEASYFGAVAVSAGNAMQLRKDTFFTQGITIIFLILFIGFFFRRKRAPLLILIPVAFGCLFALAAVYLIKGSISVIALGSGSVILGIAVNYSLHLFNHYRHTKSIRETIRDLSLPLTIGSFTTIGGFLCLEFVQSEMLKDLGLFAAFSLIGASFCTLVFLPHLITSQKEAARPAAQHSWIDRIASYKPEYNKFIIVAILLLTIVFAYTSRRVGFETDLNNMNFMSPRLREAESKLKKINVFSLQSIYLVSEGKDLNEALVNNEKTEAIAAELKNKNIIKKYSAVSSLILSDSLQQIRIRRWNAYWTTDRKQQLLATLEKEGAALKFRPAAFNPFREMLNKDFQPADTASMAAIRKNYFDDYITEKPGQTTVVTLLKAEPEHKQAVYQAFDRVPNTTVVDRQYLTNKFVEIINADFTRIALLSSILVFAVLLLTYGRIELTLVSFVPMFITFIWILGIMGIFGIRFNIINIIISAFIFGLGDDYSLFIMDGLLQEYKTGKKNLSSYKSAIFLSAITTIAGLGVLIFAKHPALRSIAVISIIGIICVVIMSQILIPFFFSFLIRNRIRKKFFPWTLAGLAKSIFSFSYFAIGSFILTAAGFILIRLNPFNKEKGKLLFHRFLSKYTWSLMYIMSNTKKRIVNPAREDFSKPAVVICNHQSFLDILVTTMLHPRLILLTNKWVWKSPVFGAVVRMADYYPVAQGAENSIDLLADRVAQGYSIVVFPEGTRTEDDTIKRFHKGAFYIAEKLGLDILPILIHGTAYTMTRGDFLLKDGGITLQFLPRIKPDDLRFGSNYSEKAKNVGRLFRAAFNKLREEQEQPAYFKEQLIYNYLYKGPVLEWYLRIKLRLEKNYQLFHELLPAKGRLLDLGCGYGFLCYMLRFASNERDLTGIDYDEEKTEVANHCFSRDGHIRFIHADAAAYDFGKYDGIIISDMLHYLQPGQQKELIEKSIRSLNPEGTLLIRDADKDLEGRHKGTRLTEFFSTRLFGFNKTSGQGLSFLSARLVHETAAAFKMTCYEIDVSKHTSNVIFVIRHP